MLITIRPKVELCQHPWRKTLQNRCCVSPSFLLCLPSCLNIYVKFQGAVEKKQNVGTGDIRIKSLFFADDVALRVPSSSDFWRTPRRLATECKAVGTHFGADELEAVISCQRKMDRSLLFGVDLSNSGTCSLVVEKRSG